MSNLKSFSDQAQKNQKTKTSRLSNWTPGYCIVDYKANYLGVRMDPKAILYNTDHMQYGIVLLTNDGIKDGDKYKGI